ncbi:MAG: metallophosphoesterase [Acidobacteriota bacterium]|nr:metallophosphoesterase [Acidobacteriota bacterium]
MAKKTDSDIHVFGRSRPSETGRFPIHLRPRRDTHFRAVPPATGNPPFQLDLKSILPSKAYKAIVSKKRLTFHMNGDTGGIKDSMPQLLVARGMEADYKAVAKAGNNPAFLYITGDCVYFNGEIKEYYNQFYHPYEFYPGPVFAVPGNHDGENLTDEETLTGFIRNFCAPKPVKMPESGDSMRTAMTQPNVYWTLLTPLVNIIGLYSNVPAGGDIRSPQTEWLVDQLKTLPKSLPLIVTLHHPVYSADDVHSGSTYMKAVLEKAEREANRRPEMVIAGHVHNYQRFTKTLENGDQVPFLVTGAGGYHNLHGMMKVKGDNLSPPVLFKDAERDPVMLERYSSDHHGFLRLKVTDKFITGRYFVVPRPQEPFSKGNQLFDHFDFDWRKRRLIPNNL